MRNYTLIPLHIFVIVSYASETNLPIAFFYIIKLVLFCICGKCIKTLIILIASTDVVFPDEITASFRRFGPLVVDWPHKAESKSYFPPKGYAFLLFQVK